MSRQQKLLRSMFDAAVASAQAEKCVPPALPDIPPNGRLIVIGAGKASAAMARAVEDYYGVQIEGLVVTRYGYSVACKHIEIIEAAHPVPDAAGMRASQRLLQYVDNLTAQDIVLCLISGGGSALLPLPAKGIDLEDKQLVNRALLACGATISEMNCVRRHLSEIKGGRLAAACYPARVINLLISDVPGDNPVDIASGPSVDDPTTLADARAIVDRYRLDLPKSVREVLETENSESIKPGDARISNVETHLIATPQMALEAAARIAHNAGYGVHILGDSLEGEASDMGIVMAGIARQVALRDQPFSKPCVLLSGGETTVTLSGDGSGGRNVEFLLSLAIALKGMPDIYALAGDTDGVDGSEEVAGAVISPDTLSRAAAMNFLPQKFLANNDGHSFFEALGDQIITGPTMTNVNDFRAILIE